MSNLIYNNNLRESVALGHVEGWEIFRKFGMNPDVDAGTEYVWPLGTEMGYETSAAVAAISSDSVDDTSAGTGAQKVMVQGLDSNYIRVEEEVTLNGLTPVNTTQTFLRIYRMYNTDVGTGGVNAGNLTATISGTVSGYIEAIEGQTHMSQYTVPAGFTLIINYVLFNAGRQANADLATQFQFRHLDQGWRTFLDTFPYEGSFTLNEPIIIVTEKSDMRVRLVGTAINTNCSTEYSGYLVNNTQFNA